MSGSDLPADVIDEAVARALREDLGDAGDITSAATVSPRALSRAAVRGRGAGVIAGIDVALAAFRSMDAGIRTKVVVADGTRIRPGETVLHLTGNTRGILAAERVALNFLCHLSGVATAAAQLVEAVAGTGATITCTRKTTPGLRQLEKYAVRCGGARNHRFGLYDAVLIKDNHIAAAGGIVQALRSARQAVGGDTRVEIEVDTLGQFRQVLECAGGADVVMLDNMRPADLERAVALNAGRVELEASGNVTTANVRRIAATGVDFISSGWITHSAPILDLALEIEDAGESD